MYKDNYYKREEQPKVVNRNSGYRNLEELATFDLINRMAKVKKSTPEYAKPFIEQIKEHLEIVKTKQSPKGKWIPKTVGIND